MPELPEVETIVRDLKPVLEGRVLRNPRLYRSDVLRGVSPRRFLSRVRNARVEAIDRRAKHIVIRLASREYLVIQLRMTGNLLYLDRRLRPAERDYVVWQAGLGAETFLVYRDVRRLGTISLLSEPQWRSYTARLGPEPLAPQFDAAALAAALRSTRQAIKKAIMDQARVAGVGNIYANEALFRAGIDPSRRSDRLTTAEVTALCREIRRVLRAAVDAGGTTLRDYRNAAGDPGEYQTALLVYGRGGEPCAHCGTTLVTTHKIDGRATTLCWRCQR